MSIIHFDTMAASAVSVGGSITVDPADNPIILSAETDPFSATAVFTIFGATGDSKAGTYEGRENGSLIISGTWLTPNTNVADWEYQTTNVTASSGSIPGTANNWRSMTLNSGQQIWGAGASYGTGNEAVIADIELRFNGGPVRFTWGLDIEARE